VRRAVVHGPNLNLLGSREPAIYGRTTLAEINGRLAQQAGELGVELEVLQSNAEGDLIAYIQEAGARVDGFLVNAAGLTHRALHCWTHCSRWAVRTWRSTCPIRQGGSVFAAAACSRRMPGGWCRSLSQKAIRSGCAGWWQRVQELTSDAAPERR
jgi:hypothetical protein